MPNSQQNPWERGRPRPQSASANQAVSSLSNSPHNCDTGASPKVCSGVPPSGGIASPLRAPISALLSFGVGLAILLIYLATGAPGAWWGDGQELACAAWTLGIPHPTGYPLYMLTGHAAMKLLRWLDPGRALTIYSALLLAGAIALLIPLFRHLIGEEREAASSAPMCACGMADLLPAAGVGLLIAFSRTAWEHATFAEVYPLTFLIGVLLLKIAWVSPTDRPGPGRAAALGVVFGLGMLNHYSILALAPLVTFCILRWAQSASSKRWRFPLSALAGFFAMLPGYLYLPLRAAANPPLNWGDPSTLSRLLWVLTGGQFKERFTQSNPTRSFAGLGRWIDWWGCQLLPERWINASPVHLYADAETRIPITLLGFVLGLALLALILFGLARLARRRWDLGLGLLAALAATAVFGAAYFIPDIDAYFLVALPAAAVGGTVALGWLARRLRVPLETPLARFARTLPALAALTVLLANYGARDKSWDAGPQDYGNAIMQFLPKDALVVTGGDADIYSLWYQQMVLGQRPDVTVYGSKFLISGWYRKYFDRPDRPKIPVYVEDIPLRQSTPVSYNVKFFKHVLLPNLAQGRPVFTTYLDPAPFDFLSEYLSPKPVLNPLNPAYLDVCAYPYLSPLVLFRLQPNPALAALDEASLAEEFTNFLRNRSRPSAFDLSGARASH